MGGKSSKQDEFVPPDYLNNRTSPYDDDWARQVRQKALIANESLTIPSRTNVPAKDPEEDSSISQEKLEMLMDKVKDLYETADSSSGTDHPAKLMAVFACLGQVWAGLCVVQAIVALITAKEKDDFDALTARIDEKFTELRARDSVIRLRHHVWEIERLLNRPIEESNELDKNVNCLMQELMVEGSTSALEEIYAYLEGGNRTKMERYILHILHFLFNGMSKNNELLAKKLGEKETREYLGKQYGPERQKKVVDNVCRILRRFDEDLEANLAKDFDKHYRNFDFLTSKYDWLHLHLTECHDAITPAYSSAYNSSDFVPRLFKRVGEFCYFLHFIRKDQWMDPTEAEISSARRALKEADGDFRSGDDRHVLMAKRLNEHQLAWWGIFYGDRNGAKFKFSNGCPTKCSVVECRDPYYEWRVLLCGRGN